MGSHGIGVARFWTWPLRSKVASSSEWVEMPPFCTPSRDHETGDSPPEPLPPVPGPGLPETPAVDVGLGPT
jgi:hypothetical protein